MADFVNSINYDLIQSISDTATQARGYLWKVAIVTVSIKETMSLGQGERSPDTDDSYFPINLQGASWKIANYCYVHARYVNSWWDTL